MTNPASTIPDYQSLMLPVLQAAEMGEVRIGDVVRRLADALSLSNEARALLLPSGRQTLFANRVHWAKTYLAKAGLVELTRRGISAFQLADARSWVPHRSGSTTGFCASSKTSANLSSPNPAKRMARLPVHRPWRRTMRSPRRTR